MRKIVLDVYNVEREVDNIIYKNLVVMIVSILGFLFLGGLFFVLVFGIFGEEVLCVNLEGYYLFLFDVVVVIIVLFVYKLVFYFIKNIWDVFVLKNGKIYLYLLIGFIIIVLI